MQVQFAKNIPLDTSSKANDDKASILVACIGVTSGYSLSEKGLKGKHYPEAFTENVKSLMTAFCSL